MNGICFISGFAYNLIVKHYHRIGGNNEALFLFCIVQALLYRQSLMARYIKRNQCYVHIGRKIFIGMYSFSLKRNFSLLEQLLSSGRLRGQYNIYHSTNRYELMECRN